MNAAAHQARRRLAMLAAFGVGAALIVVLLVLVLRPQEDRADGAVPPMPTVSLTPPTAEQQATIAAADVAGGIPPQARSWIAPNTVFRSSVLHWASQGFMEVSQVQPDRVGLLTNHEHWVEVDAEGEVLAFQERITLDDGTLLEASRFAGKQLLIYTPERGAAAESCWRGEISSTRSLHEQALPRFGDGVDVLRAYGFGPTTVELGTMPRTIDPAGMTPTEIITAENTSTWGRTIRPYGDARVSSDIFVWSEDDRFLYSAYRSMDGGGEPLEVGWAKYGDIHVFAPGTALPERAAAGCE